jgi:hypothetical protein
MPLDIGVLMSGVMSRPRENSSLRKEMVRVFFDDLTSISDRDLKFWHPLAIIQ